MRAIASDDVAAELLKRVVELRNVLEREGNEADSTGVFSQAALDALHEAGLLRLWRPQSLGGLELDPMSHAAVSEQLAAYDASAAWLVMAASNAAFDLRMAPDAFVERVYTENSNSFVCATFNKPFSAEERDGGFVVTGDSGFASGCRHANWIGHTAIVQDGKQPIPGTVGGPRVILAYHPAASVGIVDDWQSLGLRATSSNTIRAEGLLVPEERVVELSAGIVRGKHFQGPLYACPLATLGATMASVALGILRRALSVVEDIAADKVPFAASSRLADRHSAQVHYGRAVAAYRAARSFLHAELGAAWERARGGHAFELGQKAAIFLSFAHVVEACTSALRDVATIAGTTAIYRACPIERAVRDMETLRQHAFLSESRYGTFAQVAWQLPLDFPLLSMD